ncbi:MAG: hypothetical protein ACOZCF_03155 [Bacillota bacterium]
MKAFIFLGCLVFAHTQAAEKYKKIAYDILEGELKLVVNKEKTHVTSVMEGVAYLGFVIHPKYVSIEADRRAG